MRFYPHRSLATRSTGLNRTAGTLMPANGGGLVHIILSQDGPEFSFECFAERKELGIFGIYPSGVRLRQAHPHAAPPATPSHPGAACACGARAV